MAADPADFDRLDLVSDPIRQSTGRPDVRRYVGVHFSCCDVYTRVYVNRGRSAYVGHCPCCARQVRFRIGPGGTDARFFRVE
jgi:hypothetical protein